MTPDLFDETPPRSAQPDQSGLYNSLIRLGDMMGDGLHLESGGEWIRAEYRRTMKALGHLPKRRSNTQVLNESMARALESTLCPGCRGRLKQARSGSRRAVCPCCAKTYQFKTVKVPKP